MAEEKIKPYNWRFYVSRDQEQAIRRFRKLCIRLSIDPFSVVEPAIRQYMAENAEILGKAHLMTTTEINDELFERFGVRIDKQTWYDKRKSKKWAEGIDFFKSYTGSKAQFSFDVKRVWPRLINHLRKLGPKEIQDKLQDPALTAVPHRKRGSVITETLPDEKPEEIREGFRALGTIKGGWD